MLFFFQPLLAVAATLVSSTCLQHTAVQPLHRRPVVYLAQTTAPYRLHSARSSTVFMEAAPADPTRDAAPAAEHPRAASADLSDSAFIALFRTGELPIELWDHHAHVRMCYLELLDQRDSCSSAVRLFPTVAERIVHYYSKQSRFAGTFHATITGFWVQRVWDVVHHELRQGCERTSDLDTQSPHVPISLLACPSA